jgi:hypothetical protein
MLIKEHRLSPATRVLTSSPTRSRTVPHRKLEAQPHAGLSIRYTTDILLTSPFAVPLLALAPNADSSVRPQSPSRSLTSRTPSAPSPASPAAH